MRQAHEQQRMESLDTPIHSFIATKILKRLPQEMIIQLLVDQTQSGNGLQYLPPPKRQGIVAFADEVKIRQANRSAMSMILWITLLLTIIIASLVISKAQLYVNDTFKGKSESHLTSTALIRIARLNWEICMISISGFYMIETGRSALSLTPLRRKVLT